ncbi:MAG: hypothetical protein ACKPH7_11060 [Planktothrix sp.]|uniref:hypothetical protein n=1 Tax=Planktothrix sp. TaxID=3088171 RepID=UPI0038D4223E
MTATFLNSDHIDAESFNLYLTQKDRSALMLSGVAGAVGAAVLAGDAAFATSGAAGAAAKASIESGVTNAIGMISAIDGIGLAAFGVALAPMGFMLTLRVLNMVLSRV